jgi:uncharacterized membrane protein
MLKEEGAVDKKYNMKTDKKNYFKYVLGFIFCLVLRLIPFRAPNIETILAVQMPYSRVFGKIAGFLFGFLSIIVYDVLTSTLGAWTLITATTYGVLGLWAVNYFKNKENKPVDYVKFAIMSTLLFDAVTGLTVGPIIFHQSLLSAFVGQIPFTILHLAGNSLFAFILSSAVYDFALKKKKPIMADLPFNILNPQKI